MDDKDRRIAELESLLAKAFDRIAELERMLGLKSDNSSKPSSSDGLRKRSSDQIPCHIFAVSLKRVMPVQSLIHMILHGREILGPNKFSGEAKTIASRALEKGPDKWSKNQIDKERFLITDILDDVKFPKNKEEQITSAIHLFEQLIQFYFRGQKKWAASGKTLMRLFKEENPDLAEAVNKSFGSLIQTGDAVKIENLVQKILEPHGSFF